MSATALRATALLLTLATPALATEVTLLNPRAAGFSDQTPAAPVALNPGTTRGDQALVVFQTAAAIWGASLASQVPVLIDGRFVTSAQDNAFACPADGKSVVLANTGVASYHTSPSYPLQSAAYPAALAGALNGAQVSAGAPQFKVQINADLGTPRCAFPLRWYLGLDNTPDAGSDPLVTTLLHEFGHGLGFTSQVDPTSGSGPTNLAPYDYHSIDVGLGAPWTNVDDSARKSLAVTPGALAFEGGAVQASIPLYLEKPSTLTFVSADGGSPSQPPFTRADFSGPLTAAAPLVAADPLDACTTLLNASALAGKYVLIQRSFAEANLVCSFIDKAKRAAAAGAAGVVVFDRTDEALLVMVGTPGLSIPVVFIGLNDGEALRTRMAQEPVTVRFDPGTAVSNVDPGGSRVLLYTPATPSRGSSISHWATSSYPHALLMEPFIQRDMRMGMDFTPDVMSDLGWPVVGGLGVNVVKLLDPEVPAGAETSYLVVVLNRRRATVDSATLDLTLPPGTTLVSAASRPDVCTSGFPCALGAIGAGEVRLVLVKVKASSSASGAFPVTATVAATPSGASDRLTSTVSTTAATGGDLEVTVGTPTKLTPGGTATLVTTVTNKGPGAAVGVVLQGVVSGSGTPLPSVKSNSGGCNAGFPCALGTVAAGASVPVTTTLTVPDAAKNGTFTASVTQATADAVSANDSAAVPLTIAGGCSAAGGPASGLLALGVGLLLAARRRVPRR